MWDNRIVKHVNTHAYIYICKTDHAKPTTKFYAHPSIQGIDPKFVTACGSNCAGPVLCLIPPRI